MLTVLVLLGGLLVGWFARGALRPPAATGGAGVRRVMVLYDGDNWLVGPATLIQPDKKAPAVEVSGLGHTLPIGAARELVLSGLIVYVYALGRPLLIDQDALQAARRTVDLSAMFTGGGQTRQLLQWAGVLVPLVVVVMVWMQIGGINSSVTAMASEVGAVKATVVDRPVQCRVVP